MTKSLTTDEHEQTAAPSADATTAVLHVGNLHWATETAVVESVLRRVHGVQQVEVNPVAQTATVTYEPALTSIADLRRWVDVKAGS